MMSDFNRRESDMDERVNNCCDTVLNFLAFENFPETLRRKKLHRRYDVTLSIVPR